MEIALRRETAEAIRVRSTTEASQNEIDAELAKIAETSQPESTPEIHEFAGNTR
jgi:hypothetical protein